MTRRDFFFTLGSLQAAAHRPPSLLLPVFLIHDRRARMNPDQSRRFAEVWSETVRDFAACGVTLAVTTKQGEIRLSPSGNPVFTELERNGINLVITNHIPMAWDRGRALRGVSTRYYGCHLCVIAATYAHGHQVPFLSVNTCIHEMLHVLMNDIAEPRTGFRGHAREARIDLYATRLWLLNDGSAIREAVRVYLERLRPVIPRPSQSRVIDQVARGRSAPGGLS